MEIAVREFVKVVSETLPICEPVYEFGSCQTPGQEKLSDLRPLFPSKQYIGCDIAPGPGVDQILDVCHTQLPAESVGTVLLIEVLEHVEFCREAVQEAHRILKPGGLLVITSVMKHQIHAHPNDYWRFTPEGFRSLLAPFECSFVGSFGQELFPTNVVGLGLKNPPVSLEKFLPKYELWRRRRWMQLASGRKEWMVLPPILGELYVAFIRWVRRRWSWGGKLRTTLFLLIPPVIIDRYEHLSNTGVSNASQAGKHHYRGL